mmetsp:Transcript_9851/g.8689  ORF Transcript_9851/g.8689 Transcript_9851/m.8689 type:complete len:109 (-) Transcript_9851:295-621(-)
MKTNSEINLENNEMASMFKTRATGNANESGINIHSNYSPDIGEGEHISNNESSKIIKKSSTRTITSEMMKTSMNSPQNISKLFTMGTRVETTDVQTHRLQSPRLPQID